MPRPSSSPTVSPLRSGSGGGSVSPSLTRSSSDSKDVAKKLTFYFQIGLVRDVVSTDPSQLTLRTLKELACSFIASKFPDNGLVRLQERLHLFIHDSNSPHVLVYINSAAEVVEDALVEIVLSAAIPPEETASQMRPHQVSIHSYRSPTFCDYCGDMLFGLVKQGVQCDGCGKNFHKRCLPKVPNDCLGGKARFSPYNILPVPSSSPTMVSEDSAYSEADSSKSQVTSASVSVRLGPPEGRRRGERSGRAASLRIPHTWEVHSFAKPTFCNACKKLLVGFLKQGLQCRDCKLNVHKKVCPQNIIQDCSVGENNGMAKSPTVESFGAATSSTGSFLGVPRFGGRSPSGRRSEGETTEEDDLSDSELGAGTLETPSPAGDGSREPVLVDARESSNIPLQRIVQSVRHTKKKASQVLKEGWMVHFTNREKEVKRHFWRMDPKFITLYPDEESRKYSREIALEEIFSVEPAKPSGGASRPLPYCFVITMKNQTQQFFVGAPDDGQASPPQPGVGSHLAKTWETAIRQALAPLVEGAAATDMCEKDEQTDVFDGGAFSAPSSKTRDINELYKIDPTDVLGSGQFGTVYGAIDKRYTKPVAIKVIDKTRFPHKNEAQLKNEVAILQNLQHPGVVNLERMFETPERIYVVMEKMKGDMLEMILNSTEGKLDEATTRFLITQILIALKHLHSRNIVHCDLKPENCLLDSESLRPQVKICDFGFSRIIGEKSFRRSVVGTPAYLAPEVLRNKKYNRSLDMWSVGVIIYVSLSGTFPFNEEEDITDQIKNASFMYPPNPWKDISPAAINLISSLLQVQANKRFSVDKTLIHPWLQDYETWCDLRRLETKVGGRYLTHESDDVRWERFRAERDTLRDPYSFIQ